MTDSAPETASAYERIGGEAALRVIIEDFVDRVMRDMMIGFFFRKVNRARLCELELQFASQHLGGPHEYSGRPLEKAHAAHPIMGGQFDRRLRLLQKTLTDHQVPQDVIAAWLEHNEALRSKITGDRSGECNDPHMAKNLGSPATAVKKD